MRNVLAVWIGRQGAPGRTETETLSVARRLADGLRGALQVAVAGPCEDWARQAIAYGADRVARVVSPALAEYAVEPYVAALEQLFRAHPADVLFLPASTYGLEVAPLLGYRIGAAVLQDCVAVTADESGGAVTLIKPVYGGKAHLRLRAATPPLLVVMRMRSVEPLPPAAGRSAEVIDFHPQAAAQPPRSRLLERRTESSEGVRLEDARVIVSGGRGMGCAENFSLLQKLAGELGGALGASRAACDLGWVPASLQIGQTGKKVAPELYLAVGISGASQHMVGVTGARHVVAVNKDPKAPIFQAAEIGVAEDFKAFLPVFLEELKRQKNS